MLTINTVQNIQYTPGKSPVRSMESLSPRPSFKGVPKPVQFASDNFITRLVKIFKARNEIKEFAKIDFRAEGAAQKYINLLSRVEGLPEGLVKVSKELPTQPNSIAEINFLNGEIRLNSPIINQHPEVMLAPYLIHEYDHFEKAAKTCKLIGVEEFEKIVTSNGQLNGFDRNFWSIASESISVSKKFDVKKYTNALKEMMNNFNIDWNRVDNENIYNYLLRDFRYITNPFEASAHKAQNRATFNLVQFDTREWIKKPFSKVETLLDSIINARNLKKEAKPILFQQFYVDTIIKNDENLSELFAKYLAEPSEETLSKYQQAFIQRSAQLNANILGLPLKVVLKDKADMLYKTARSLEKCNDGDIITAYTEALNFFMNKINNPDIGQNKERYTNLLRENTSDFLNFMTENNYEAPELLLNLRLNNAVLMGGIDLSKLKQLHLY